MDLIAFLATRNDGRSLIGEDDLRLHYENLR